MKPEYPHLSENVRRLRHAREMSQQTLADAIGVPQSYVSQIERGLKPWRDSQVDDLARALGVSRVVLTAAPIELTVRSARNRETSQAAVG